jgi:tRNA modification GTPase
MSVVIAGQPNAGKSSLLNALAGRETAIVTEVPGTTRDVLREEIQLSGMPLHVIDTAGLRQSDDPVEQIGIRRAWEQIQQADRLLLVVDDIQGFAPEDQAIIDQLPENLPCTVIRNKADLSGRETGMAGDAGHHEVIVSAKTGQGLDELREHLLEVMGFNTAGEGHFIARRRHLDALQQAGDAMISARQRLVGQQAELLAEDLRQAQQHLSSITGEFSSDDLLGRIFSDFCIGK